MNSGTSGITSSPSDERAMVSVRRNHDDPPTTFSPARVDPDNVAV
jgi:hypothetical protein